MPAAPPSNSLLGKYRYTEPQKHRFFSPAASKRGSRRPVSVQKDPQNLANTPIISWICLYMDLQNNPEISIKRRDTLCESRSDQRSSNAPHKCVHFPRRHDKKQVAIMYHLFFFPILSCLFIFSIKKRIHPVISHIFILNDLLCTSDKQTAFRYQ